MRYWIAICCGMAVVFASLRFDALPANAEPVGLERVASGLDRPIFVTHAPGDHQRLFIVEKPGTIKILDLHTGTVNATPFLIVPDTDANANEEGLLGLAFHPDYATNGKFYINVTVDDGGAGAATRTHIRQYTVSENPNVANRTALEVLTFNQPQSNHNGGWIGFSPGDGYLYIATGDGGNANDTGAGHTSGTGNAQDTTNNLLGKMLRIDVDGTNGSTGNYGIPADNPFVGVAGDDEIWSYGLRNPWRASFDRATGDLWIGDVGQDNREEIDFQPASSAGGENYGWRLREGTIATPAPGIGGPAPAGAIEPVYDYGRGNGDFQGGAVVGGYVYRGSDPDLFGKYVFADTLSGNIWTMIPGETPVVDNVEADLPPNVGSLPAKVSFGEDAAGNLYIVNLGSSSFQPALGSGSIYRIVTNAVTLAGDYNQDGVVDAADYVVWRNHLGSVTSLPNDLTPGVDENDYLVWKENYGATVGGAVIATIPEPTSLALLSLGVLALMRRER